jgi:ribokinase
VVGSINMDIVATTSVIPVPGQTVSGEELHYYPGGKGANQAVASQRAGAPTRMVGKVGNDGLGVELKDYLSKETITVDSVDVTDGSSGIALIIVQSSGENSIVVVPGANGKVDEACLPEYVFNDAAVGISQFEIPTPTIEAFFAGCRHRGIVTVLNTAPAVDNIGNTLDLADVLVLNETELNAYASSHITRDSEPEEVFKHARRLRRFKEQSIVVTLGSRGAVALDIDEEIVVTGVKVDAIDTTGAGDCFVGYLAAGIAGGMDMRAALTRAGQAAAMSVQKAGAGPSMPHLADLG